MAEIEELALSGLLLVKLKSYRDSRGFFCERFNMADFGALGLPTAFLQDNFSRSSYGVLRGLHYQTGPAQGKLVTCLAGEIFDVVVDLRMGSPTYKEHCGVVLRGDKPSWLWIPPGFAHGFCVLSRDGADVLYKVDAPYAPHTEKSINFRSKGLGISWPDMEFNLSNKDLHAEEFNPLEHIVSI